MTIGVTSTVMTILRTMEMMTLTMIMTLRIISVVKELSLFGSNPQSTLHKLSFPTYMYEIYLVVMHK